MKNLLKKLAVILCVFLFHNHVLKAVDYYWVGGTGNWSDFGNHWATTSGGSIFHIQPPTPSDNVIFDANSFIFPNDTVFVDSTIVNCLTMDWSGAGNNPVLKGFGQWGANTLTVYGSIILNANMQWRLNGKIDMVSSLNGNMINTYGIALFDSLIYSEIDLSGSGSWYLQSDLNTQNFIINSGSFYSNNFTINAETMIFQGSPANPAVYFGTSVINGYFSSYVYINADSATFNCNYFKAHGGGIFNDVSCETIEANGATIKYVQCGYIYGDSNSFNNVQFVDWNCDYFYTLPCNYIGGDNNYFHHASIPCSYIEIDGKQIFDSLIFTNPGQIIRLHDDSLLINSYIDLAGTCSGLSSLISDDTATVFIAGGTYTFDYLYIKNIKFEGGATLAANNSIDAEGNSGITINSPSPRMLYWVGGTGSWNDPSHWAVTSGGAGGACIPNRLDSLFFDVNSFQSTGDTVFADAAFLYCQTMDWSGAVNSPVFQRGTNQTQVNIYGSFILTQNMTWNVEGTINLSSGLSNNIINTQNVDLGSAGYIYVEDTGSWSLQSDFTAYSIYFKHGTFNTNNYHVHSGMQSMYNGSSVTINLGTSLIDGGEFYFSQGNGIVINAANATLDVNYFGSPESTIYHDVTCTSLSAVSCSFHDVYCYNISGDNNTFHNVVLDSLGFNYLSGQNNSIQSLRAFKSFIFGNGPGSSYNVDSLFVLPFNAGIEFTDGSLLTINKYISINGSCSGFASLICNSGMATIHKNFGNLSFSYLYIKNISTSGNATFTANNSIDAGGNSGWIINTPAPRNLYWVGGKGSWNDISHWSLSSGGTGGACIPNQYDDIFFDGNSFASGGDTVFMEMENVFVHTLDCSAITNSPVFYGGYDMFVFGSFMLGPDMSWNCFSYLLFMSDTAGCIINTGGIPLPSTTVYFSGAGSWDLADSLSVYRIRFENGTFNSNNFDLNVGSINPDYYQPVNPVLNFGSSLIVAGTVDFKAPNAIVHADSAVFICQNFTSTMGAQSYNEIICNGQLSMDSCSVKYADCSMLSGSHNVFNNIKFSDNNYISISGSDNIFHTVIIPAQNAFIGGNNTFDTLVFNNTGQVLTFSDTTSVNNLLIIQSSAAFPTKLTGLSGAAISKPADTVCTDFIYMDHINAMGGAVFYAGNHSVDLGNNTGWAWTSCTPDTSNVWPGDANYDLTADNIDILYIGLAYGYAGPVRAGASINWVAQPGIDWLQQFATGYNIKHADCDGNGIVNTVDTNAVILNYGQVHPFKQSGPPAVTNFGTPLYFDFPPGALTPGSTVDIPIMFGTASEPANQFYGVAFTVNYDPSLIQPGSMEITFGNTWFGNGSNTIHINKDFYNNGMIDMAFVKIDHADEAGFGTFATLHFVLANNASGPMNLSFSKILVLDKYEIQQPVNVINGSVYTGVDEVNSFSYSIFPNPVSDVLHISTAARFDQARLYGVDGKIVITQKGLVNDLNVADITNGVYVLELWSGNSVCRKKVVINH
jgi:hypothetical protein